MRTPHSSKWRHRLTIAAEVAAILGAVATVAGAVLAAVAIFGAPTALGFL